MVSTTFPYSSQTTFVASRPPSPVQGGSSQSRVSNKKKGKKPQKVSLQDFHHHEQDEFVPPEVEAKVS
jgi:hypothetical protein